MKKILSMLAVVALAVTASAAIQSYTTLAGYGNATKGATVYFPSESTSQIRIVYANYASETNNSALSFRTGTTAYSITATNSATTTVTNYINSTNGLSIGSALYLEHLGVGYTNTVAAFNGTSTNVVLTAGGWGVFPSVGDTFYVLGTATTVPATGTNALSGDAIFVGGYGRPVEAILTPCLATNKIWSMSAKYEQ